MSPESTCWSIIHGAAAGADEQQARFVEQYLPVVRSYLLARWSAAPMSQQTDDAVQEVLLECLRPGGALSRVDLGRPGGFRAFLYGVVRNVALRFETRRGLRPNDGPGLSELVHLPADDTSLSRIFDRAWAVALVKEAALRQAEIAIGKGPAAEQRVELLRLRFQEGLPIRDIATRNGIDPVLLHRDYAIARQEFKAALLETVAFHHPGTPAEVAHECQQLLALLG